MLGIVVSYHCIQFQEKLKIETEKNVKKPHFGPDLEPLSPNLGRYFYYKTSSYKLFQTIMLCNLK